MATSQLADVLQGEQKASGSGRWTSTVGYPILIILLPALVALAVVLDKQSRRGYALGALALGTLVLALWGYGPVSQAEPPLGFAFVFVFGGLYVALALTLGAIGETLMARQWWWLGIIVIVSVVPAVIMFTSRATRVPNLLGALGLNPGAAYLVVQLPPLLITCAYAMARSIRRPLAR